MLGLPPGMFNFGLTRKQHPVYYQCPVWDLLTLPGWKSQVDKECVDAGCLGVGMTDSKAHCPEN